MKLTWPLMAILFVIFSNAQAAPLTQFGRYGFVPNQVAAANWYRPGGVPLNGHIEGSFSDQSLWPYLHYRLAYEKHPFGIYSAEGAFLEPATINQWHAEGIPLSVEMPAMTQCRDGWDIGHIEFFGYSDLGGNPFCSIFGICNPTDRIDPNGRGWFYTKYGAGYVPDEVITDHHILGALDTFNTSVLFNGSIPWAQRKQQARQTNCDTSFNGSIDKVTGLIYDYLEYSRVMKQKFNPAPQLSLHWNVHPAWEWTDEACLDNLKANYADNGPFENAFRYLQSPCFRDTQVLSNLVDALCADGTCPRVVYMDVDLTYNTGYALTALQRNKTALAARGIGFGVNLVDECGSRLDCAMGVDGSGNNMAFYTIQPTPNRTSNMLHQESILNKLNFLITKGIVDQNTHLRISSWDLRPQEVGPQINEFITGTMSHTAKRVYNEILLPRGWVAPLP